MVRDVRRAAWGARSLRPIGGCRDLMLVSGLRLPIWSRLPDKAASVRRLKAPEGRRWLDRVLDPGQVPHLKAA